MIPRTIAANEIRTGDRVRVSYRGALVALHVLSRKLTCGGAQVDLELASAGDQKDIHKILGASAQVVLLDR